MRSPHHLHGVFDVAPLSGFFGVALVLASLGILGRLDDSLEAVLLEHLTRDHVNLYLSQISCRSSCASPTGIAGRLELIQRDVTMMLHEDNIQLDAVIAAIIQIDEFVDFPFSIHPPARQDDV